ncbi:MAG: hypothetical protein HY466_01220 [Deltaproteobacteria bacterium]|nr:hypothetical protein [Deltaproteobacteria bacterium]
MINRRHRTTDYGLRTTDYGLISSNKLKNQSVVRGLWTAVQKNILITKA